MKIKRRNPLLKPCKAITKQGKKCAYQAVVGRYCMIHYHKYKEVQ